MKRILSFFLIALILVPLTAETAVWYTQSTPDGKTGSGKLFSDKYSYAASDAYTFGTILEVTNLANGKSTILTVEDRLPEGLQGRSIAVTSAAVKELGMQETGKAEVSIKIVRGNTLEEETNELTGWYALYAGTYNLDDCWKYYQRFLKNGLKPSVVETDQGYALYAKYLSSFELKDADNAIALSGISSSEAVPDKDPLNK